MKLPCKDCIVLPICQAEFHGGPTLHPYVNVNRLYVKCSILTTYIKKYWLEYDFKNMETSMLRCPVSHHPVISFFTDNKYKAEGDYETTM